MVLNQMGQAGEKGKWEVVLFRFFFFAFYKNIYKNVNIQGKEANRAVFI